MPKTMRPELCATRAKPPEGAEWVYEIKWDGYRAIARINNSRAECFSRSGAKLKLPEVEAELERLGVADAWIDGEAVAFDADGVSRFSLVHAIHNIMGRGFSMVGAVGCGRYSRKSLPVRAMNTE